MTVGLYGIAHPSLEAFVHALRMKISRAGIHLRFTKEAVSFMEKCARTAFTQSIPAMPALSMALTRHFKRVMIIDSTSWDINPRLRSAFPGSGNQIRKSANCKVQLCFEYLRGILSFFEITPGIKPDNGYARSLAYHIDTGDLVITDLGYFCLEYFQKICSAGAYFLSRLLHGVALYDATTNRHIDLLKLLKNTAANTREMQITMGRIGCKHQVACRLICLRVDTKTAELRRRRLKLTARRKSRAVSKKRLFLAQWTILVTNIPARWLPADKAWTLYRVRWHIELIFKQMKSVLHINARSNKSESRFRCELLGKFIMAIMLHRLHAHAHVHAWNKEKIEISIEKFYKRIKELSFLLMQFLLQSPLCACNYLRTQWKIIVWSCRKNKQKSRRTLLEDLSLANLQT
jgi:hypothetical protein